jgi:hypothetical protein
MQFNFHRCEEIVMRNFALVLTCSTYFLVCETALAQEKLTPPPKLEPPIEFTGPDQGWPPDVKGAENIQVMKYELLVSAMTPAFAARLDEVVRSSAEVQKSLGERFAFIEASVVEESKEQDIRPLERQLTKVVYYSYSRNVAVAALVRGGEVLRAEDLEGYQPPEAPQEIDEAVKLARADSRLQDIVKGEYEGRGLVTERDEGLRGAGNRLIYVSFMKPGTANTEYFALVDLTDGIVLEAGRAAGAN